MNLQFIPFRREFYDEYASWFGDAELKRHLGPMDAEWLEAVLSEPEIEGVTWAVFRGTELVGVAEVKYPPKSGMPVGITGVAVKPALRGQGIGSEIMRELLARDYARGFVEHTGIVSPENPGAWRFLERLGFERIGIAPCGSNFIEFRYRAGPTAWNGDLRSDHGARSGDRRTTRTLRLVLGVCLPGSGAIEIWN